MRNHPGEFELVIGVRAGGTAPARSLVLRLQRPTPWALVRPHVAGAAGLPGDCTLYLGAAAIGPHELVGLPPLLTGIEVSSTAQPSLPAAPTLVLDCVAGPDAGASVGVPPAGAVTIGRSARCDLNLADPQLSARHAELRVDDTGSWLRDLGSTNGIAPAATDQPTPRGGRCARLPAPLGEPLRVGGSVLRTDLGVERPLLRHPDGAGRWVLTLPAGSCGRFGVELPDDPGPPPERPRQPIPLVAALATAAVGLVIAVLTQLWFFLLLAALGPATMLASAVGDRVAGRRPYRIDLAEHRERVDGYRAAVRAGREADRADAWERFADPPRLLRWARAGAVGLWSQTADGTRETVVGMSVGTRPLRCRAGTGPPVSGVPLAVRLPPAGVIGVVGRRRSGLRWLLAQLAGQRAPDDRPVRVLSGRADLAALADLPHCRDGTRIGEIAGSADDFLAALRRLQAGRCGAGTGPTGGVLAVVDDVQRYRDHAGLRRLLSAPDDGLLLLAVATDAAALPASCTAVLDLDALPGEPIGVSHDYLAALCAALAPLTADRGGAPSGSTVLPSTVAAPPVTAGELARRWRGAREPVAELGVTGHGPLRVNLRTDGPHLLLAGTTGAGKSELLQTLIGSLATHLPPDRLALLLIDYKGGAAFARAAGLPHCCGVLTDLDAELAPRALISLRAELRRREKVLAQLGISDLSAPEPAAGAGPAREAAAADTGDRGGAAGASSGWVPAGPERPAPGPSATAQQPPRPPRLVIVVDEFATLAAELPDFLLGLVDIAQRGRSLGLHLVLATQRPAGVVTPAILANIALRICLRVTDAADSSDVLGHPAAASIPAELPGRGYLRSAGAPRTAFQAARLTAPSPPAVSVWPRRQPAPPPAGPSALTQLLAAARMAAAGLSRPAPPWLPPLPATLTAHDDRQLGLLDLPERQSQVPWLIPAGSMLIAGTPGSGRTSVLRRWLGAADHDDAVLLVIGSDAGWQRLAAQGRLTSLLADTQPRLVLRLLELLADELDRRVGGAAADAPPVALAIDDWEPLAGALDAVDFGSWSTRLAEIAGRGPAVGIRVAVAGGQRLLQHRVAAAMGDTVTLGIATPTGELRAGRFPGRGRLLGGGIGVSGHRFGGDGIGGDGSGTGAGGMGAGGAAVQFAVPPDPAGASGTTGGPKVSPRQNLSAPVAAAANGQPRAALTATGATGGESADELRRRLTVRPLPATVDTLTAATATPALIPIGLGGDRAEPVGFDLSGAGGGLLVAGPRRSGVSTALAHLLTGAAAAGLPAARVLTGDHRPHPLPGVRDLRQPAEVATEGELLTFLAAHEGPLLLAVDDADRLTDTSLGEVLTRFLSVAGRQQFLALGARLDEAGRTHRGPIAATAGFRTGVLLGADSFDGAVLGAQVPRRTGPARTGRGHLVIEGVAQQVQVARAVRRPRDLLAIPT